MEESQTAISIKSQHRSFCWWEGMIMNIFLPQKEFENHCYRAFYSLFIHVYSVYIWQLKIGPLANALSPLSNSATIRRVDYFEFGTRSRKMPSHGLTSSIQRLKGPVRPSASTSSTILKSKPINRTTRCSSPSLRPSSRSSPTGWLFSDRLIDQAPDAAAGFLRIKGHTHRRSSDDNVR